MSKNVLPPISARPDYRKNDCQSPWYEGGDTPLPYTINDEKYHAMEQHRILELQCKQYLDDKVSSITRNYVDNQRAMERKMSELNMKLHSNKSMVVICDSKYKHICSKRIQECEASIAQLQKSMQRETGKWILGYQGDQMYANIAGHYGCVPKLMHLGDMTTKELRAILAERDLQKKLEQDDRQKGRPRWRPFAGYNLSSQKPPLPSFSQTTTQISQTRKPPVTLPPIAKPKNLTKNKDVWKK